MSKAAVEENPLQRKVPKKTFWQKQKAGFIKNKNILWFIIPAFLVSLVFSYIPMFGVTFAFKDTLFDVALKRNADIIGALRYSNWTFDTFLSIFDDRFADAILNSVIINALKILIVFPISILIAIQLSELKSQTLAKIILIILCIPNFLSWTVVIKAWTNLLDPNVGFIGKMLKGITNGESITYYQWTFKPLFLFYAAWKGSGWGSILYYAAITSIDKSYYESATLDGANKIQKAIHFTIPAIAGTIALMLVLNISGFTSVGLEQIKLMLESGNSTRYYQGEMTLDLYIWEITIGQAAGVSYVKAAAVGVFNGLIGLTLMLLGNLFTTKVLKRGLW